MSDASWWYPDGEGVVISVRVTPSASRDQIVGPVAGRLRIRVAAPPADGMANERLCRLLAREFGVRPSAVSVQRGAKSREKDIAVAGLVAPPAGFGEST